MLNKLSADVRLFSVEWSNKNLALLVGAKNENDAKWVANDLIRLAMNWVKTEKGMKKSHASLYRLLTKYSTARATMKTGKSKDVAVRFVGSDNDNVFIFKNQTLVEMEMLGLIQIDGDTVGLAWERSGFTTNYSYWCRLVDGAWVYNCAELDKRPAVTWGGYASLDAIRRVKNDTADEFQLPFVG